MSDKFYAFHANLFVVQEEHKKFMLEFGHRISSIRQKQGLTKVQLAFEINTGEKYIRRLEKGEINLTLITALKLSTALNIPIHELMNLDSRI